MRPAVLFHSFLVSCAPLERSEDRPRLTFPDSPVPDGVSEEAWRIHRGAIQDDGQDDPPWAMRTKAACSLEAKDLARTQPDLLELAGSVEDVLRLRRTGRIERLIGAGGGHSIESSIGVLRRLHRGYTEEAIRKGLGGNALRALRAAEEVAGS